MRPVRLFLSGVFLVAALSTLVACNDSEGGAPAPVPPGVSRESFGTARPAGTSGLDLAFGRVTIEPGASLAPHTHPGTQLARVEAGTLSYTVYHGEVTVNRKDGKVEKYGPGPTIAVETGETLIEPRAIVHAGRNDGTEAVVLLTTSLFEAGQPGSRLAKVD